jgi:hypothetical protein
MAYRWYQEVIHDACLQNMKMQIFVMPAWIAGIQFAGMLPETSMSAWIPALHAGMTQSRVLLELTEAPPPRIFKGGVISHRL